MTTAQLVQRLANGEKITLKELHRLEARLASLYLQAGTIEGVINCCYTPKGQSRVPNPQIVGAAP